MTDKKLTYEVGLDADAIIEAVKNGEPASPPKQEFPPRPRVKLSEPAWREYA
jgi:hypothetical protein